MEKEKWQKLATILIAALSSPELLTEVSVADTLHAFVLKEWSTLITTTDLKLMEELTIKDFINNFRYSQGIKVL